MKHPLVIQHIEQATGSTEAWEDFFRMCKEMAETARQRRRANRQQTEAAPLSHAPTEENAG